MTASERVANPIQLSLGEPGVPRFQFVALDAYVPRGDVTTVAEGINLHSFPWFAEFVGRYVDRAGRPLDSWWCVYRLPIAGTDIELLAACVDSAPESLFHVLMGRDHGDALATVLARDWPDIHAMLEASTASDLSRRLLLAMEGEGGRQWMVADAVIGEARQNITPAQFENLIVSALSVAVRTNNWITELPGILELGPDLTTRRLRGIAGLLSGAADLGGAAEGFADRSLDPQALRAAVDAARDLPDHIRSIFG